MVINWARHLSGNHQGLFVLSSWGGEIPQKLPVSGLGEERSVWQFSGRQTEDESRVGVGAGVGKGSFIFNVAELHVVPCFPCSALADNCACPSAPALCFNFSRK